MKIQNKQNGFTLVETLVAVVVLILGITPILILSYQSIKAKNISGDQVIASFLAQDAMEYVLAKRDWNNDQGNDWLDGFGDCFNDCRIDTTKSLSGNSAFNSNENSLIKFNPSGGYSYSGGEETDFKRIVGMETLQVDDAGNPIEVIVKVKMLWKNAGDDQEFVIATTIFK